MSNQVPLSEILRPETLDDFLGQEHLTGHDSILRKAIESGNIPSMIFWGPPGVGKTTLANIISKKTNRPFFTLSAISSGVKPSQNQIDDLMHEIQLVIARNERVLVTTLTKKMAEELTKYFTRLDIRCRYIHSDVDTLERVEIMRDLRLGAFDVLVGVNLLREGLDLPEVSLVAILDADKEGFLRSHRSLTQTAGRAARNINSKVIMYADKITDSMEKTIDETNRRRVKQMDYNLKNDITPTQITRSTESIMGQTSVMDGKGPRPYIQPEYVDVAADPVLKYMNAEELKKEIARTRKEMEQAVKAMDFMEAARLRDEMFGLEALLKERK